MNTCRRRLDATLDELNEFDADVKSSEEGAEMAERQLGGRSVADCHSTCANKRSGAAKKRCMNTCRRRLDATLDELNEFDADVKSSEEGAEMAERQLGGRSVAHCHSTCANKRSGA